MSAAWIPDWVELEVNPGQARPGHYTCPKQLGWPQLGEEDCQREAGACPNHTLRLSWDDFSALIGGYNTDYPAFDPSCCNGKYKTNIEETKNRWVSMSGTQHRVYQDAGHRHDPRCHGAGSGCSCQAAQHRQHTPHHRRQLMSIIIDNTDHDERLIHARGLVETAVETAVEAGTAALITVDTVFEPRLVVADDAIYVAHDDGYIRKWTLVGEQAEEFAPIPIAGPG